MREFRKSERNELQLHQNLESERQRIERERERERGEDWRKGRKKVMNERKKNVIYVSKFFFLIQNL